MSIYKTAIVTGASRGLGKAIKEKFEKENIKVYGIDSKNCDIRDESNIIKFLKGIKSVDILINNAGITSKRYDLDTDNFDNIINVNLRGAFLMCKYVLPKMNYKGTIINISSIAALDYSKYSSVAYTISKTGLTGLTNQLKQDYENLKIKTLYVPTFKSDMSKNINISLTAKDVAWLVWSSLL
jgi:NAD(P)-dependent dehydrogenase (short-subunit alcohol dehydrogenase family)